MLLLAVCWNDGGENLKRHINNNNSSVDALKCSNLPGVFLTTYGTGELLCFAGTNRGLG